ARGRARTGGGDGRAPAAAPPELPGPDRGTEPGDAVLGRAGKCSDGALEHACAQAAPASMSRRNTRPRAVAQQDREAIGDLNGAHHVRGTGEGGVRTCLEFGAVRPYNIRAL